MTLDKIFKEGNFVTKQRTGSTNASYTVKVTITKDGTSIIFKGNAIELFKGKKIVPIIVNGKDAKRVYFAPENKVNATGSNSNPGYTVSSREKNGGYYDAKLFMRTGDKFKDFVGEYKKLHLDADCMLYFIERPTRF